MVELLNNANAAQAVGGAWFLKELFAFFLKLRRQDKQDNSRMYRPDQKWQQYCVQKFELLSKELHEVYTAQKVMEMQIKHLEKTIRGIVK